MRSPGSPLVRDSVYREPQGGMGVGYFPHTLEESPGSSVAGASHGATVPGGAVQGPLPLRNRGIQRDWLGASNGSLRAAWISGELQGFRVRLPASSAGLTPLPRPS